MAISKQIFNAPIPGTYDPSERIDRSMNRLGENIGGIIRQESERKQERQADFGEMYANLGELDAQLQENYAGMMQEAVTSTRDWLKDNYKKGANQNDPEFIRELSRRTSRIKAGMGTADRKREEATRMAKLIEINPNMTFEDKGRALDYVYSKSNNPDYLISKNDTNLAEEVARKFEAPNLVSSSFTKSIQTDSVNQFDSYDDKGNLKRTTVKFNRFINPTEPVNPDGTLNIQVSKEDTQKLMSGDYGGSVLRNVTDIKNQRYSNQPTDFGYQLAFKDFLALSMGGSHLDTKIIKTKGDIDSEKIAQNQRQQTIDLSKEREERLSAGDVETEEVNDRWQSWNKSIDEETTAIFGDFQKAAGDRIKDIEWIKPTLVTDTESYDKWKSLDRDIRVEALEQYPELAKNVPVNYFGAWKTDSEEAYNAIKEAVEKDLKNGRLLKIKGIRWKEKGATQAGKVSWDTRKEKLLTRDDKERVFKMFEGNRVSGQKYKPVAEVPEEEGLGEYDEFVMD